ANTNAEALCPFDAADSRSQFTAQKTRVGRFIGEPPHGGQAHVDRGRCEVLLFEEEAVAEDNSSVKRQTRFRTVPADEFLDGMTVGFLRTGCGERGKDCILLLLQVGQAKYCFSLGGFRGLPPGHTGGLPRRSQYGRSTVGGMVSKPVSGQCDERMLR